MQYIGQNQEYAINTNKIIGKGNYGQVFECQQKGSQQSLCAKVLTIYKDNKTKLSEKDMDREKQITEIVKKNQLNPNLVKIHYVEHNKEKSCLIIIMERCSSTLQQEWNETNIYKDYDVLDFIKQFVNGYKALFDANIIHRDIKPENILIQQIGQQKYYRLADFGIGRIYKLNDFKLTKLGTPAFASPELNSLILDQELDQKFATMKKMKNVVDIYSLGIILHMMITGGYPFSLDQRDIIRFINQIKITPFKFQPCVNSRLANLIERMIVYDPTQRLTFQQLSEEIIRLTISVPKFNTNNIPNQNFSQQKQPNLFRQFPPQDQPQTSYPNLFLTGGQIQIQKNVSNEICNYLKKFLYIHRKTLNQQSLDTIQAFILGNFNLIGEIGKLYDNFDKNNNQIYSDDDVNFYYCLKYVQRPQLAIKTSRQEQLYDLCS